jgi:hypothetical protein
MENYAEELIAYHADLEKVAGNGERVTLNDERRYVDDFGRYGYHGWLTGEYICYTDGNYCECGEEE